MLITWNFDPNLVGLSIWTNKRPEIIVGYPLPHYIVDEISVGIKKTTTINHEIDGAKIQNSAVYEYVYYHIHT